MSNCLRASGRFTEGVLLDPEMFSGVKAAEDVDGTKIVLTPEGPVLTIGTTTWRELRTFLWQHVQPFVTRHNVKIPMVLVDESDGFREPFKATAKLFPPGSVCTSANWRSIL